VSCAPRHPGRLVGGGQQRLHVTHVCHHVASFHTPLQCGTSHTTRCRRRPQCTPLHEWCKTKLLQLSREVQHGPAALMSTRIRPQATCLRLLCLGPLPHPPDCLPGHPKPDRNLLDSCTPSTDHWSSDTSTCPCSCSVSSLLFGELVDGISIPIKKLNEVRRLFMVGRATSYTPTPFPILHYGLSTTHSETGTPDRTRRSKPRHGPSRTTGPRRFRPIALHSKLK